MSSKSTIKESLEKLQKLLANEETHHLGIIYAESLYLDGKVSKYLIADYIEHSFNADWRLMRLHSVSVTFHYDDLMCQWHSHETNCTLEQDGKSGRFSRWGSDTLAEFIVYKLMKKKHGKSTKK